MLKSVGNLTFIWTKKGFYVMMMVVSILAFACVQLDWEMKL